MATAAMVLVSAFGFLRADAERNRLQYLRAMQRCMVRLHSILNKRQPEIADLLCCVDLGFTRQERELTRLFRACAERMRQGEDLPTAFSQASARFAPGYFALPKADRAVFERCILELGRLGLREQLVHFAVAETQMGSQIEGMANDTDRRVHLIKTLSVCGGAALFLILIE